MLLLSLLNLVTFVKYFLDFRVLIGIQQYTIDIIEIHL